MKEFRRINILSDLEQLYKAWECLDAIVHAYRTTEYPEDFEDKVCDIFEEYCIDYTKNMKGGE